MFISISFRIFAIDIELNLIGYMIFYSFLKHLLGSKCFFIKISFQDIVVEERYFTLPDSLIINIICIGILVVDEITCKI